MLLLTGILNFKHLLSTDILFMIVSFEHHQMALASTIFFRLRNMNILHIVIHYNDFIYTDLYICMSMYVYLIVYFDFLPVVSKASLGCQTFKALSLVIVNFFFIFLDASSP